MYQKKKLPYIKITNNLIITLLQKNKLLALAALFFLIWKFFLIGVLWNDRALMPEPDDSYTYAGYINSIKECPTFFCNYPNISFKNYTAFTYLSYSIFFGGLAKIFNATPTTIFHLSFYLGTLIILPILIYTIRVFTRDAKLIALSLIFLALYNGSGSYHGFFWVVPSFFAVAIFLLIFALLLNNHKNWTIYLSLSTLILLYIHPIGLYSIGVFPIFYTFYSALSKKLNLQLLKKIIFLTLVSILFYLPLYIHKNKSIHSDPFAMIKLDDSIKTTIITSKSKLPIFTIPHTEKTAQSYLATSTKPEMISPITVSHLNFNPLWENYFIWLFPHWIIVIPFLIIIYLLFYYRALRLLSLYFSLLIFVCLSSLFNTYGFRSVVLIWPITYIIYCFGFWYALRFIKERVRRHTLQIIFKIILFVSLSFFVLLNLTYSLSWNQLMNQNENISLNDAFIPYLLEVSTPTTTITCNSKILHSYILNSKLITRNIYIQNTPTMAVTYFVTLEPIVKKDSPSTNLNLLLNTISIITQQSRKEAPPNQPTAPQIPNNFKLEKTFGEITIYKNTK